MAWFLIYDQASGRLVSQADVAPDAAALAAKGLASASLAARPDRSQMWDEATRALVSRPAKVLRDRIQDATQDADFTGLNSQQRTRLLAWLHRYFDDVKGA